MLTISTGYIEESIYGEGLGPLEEEGWHKLQRTISAKAAHCGPVRGERDAAAKGGNHQTPFYREDESSRCAQRVALGKPSVASAGQWYFQRRYVVRPAGGGEMVLLTASWYNGPVLKGMGFAYG